MREGERERGRGGGMEGEGARAKVTSMLITVRDRRKLTGIHTCVHVCNTLSEILLFCNNDNNNSNKSNLYRAIRH